MQILIVDDDQALCRSLQLLLERERHQVFAVHTGEEGVAGLLGGMYDLAFLDLNLPGASGLDILRQVKGAAACPLIVMITGVQDAKSTIEAIRYGAFDYIRKPLDLDAVYAAVEKASAQFAAAKIVKTEPVTAGSRTPREIIGAHPAIIDVLKQIALVSDSGVPVLIQGESGTGKELVARALHETGNPGTPFVAVNCSAVVPTLLESELFGHVKGAFTGADADKTGKLEAAGAGTVFFDEIGDMSIELQAKLLRVLQEREFERVGSTKTLPFRARVIAATHRDLKTMAAQTGFREDLYYRLAVSTIHLPALRERRTDIPLLVEHMLGGLAQELHKEVNAIDQKALNRCMAYDWPGNVRELANVLTRAVLLARGPVLTDLMVGNAMGAPAGATAHQGEIRTLREIEMEHIEKALLATGWNISRSSELLDVTRVTLRKKIDDYGLHRPGNLEGAS